MNENLFLFSREEAYGEVGLMSLTPGSLVFSKLNVNTAGSGCGGLILMMYLFSYVQVLYVKYSDLCIGCDQGMGGKICV